MPKGKAKAAAALAALETRKRREFSAPVRREALKRSKDKDGVPRCKSCGADVALKKKFFDHIHRDVDGGQPTIENCQVLCKVCHDRKTGHEKTEHSKALRAKDHHQGTKAPPKSTIPQPPKKDKPAPKPLPPRRGGIFARYYGPEE